MNNTDVMDVKKVEVDEKTRWSFLWRWFFTSSVSSNYERMQALAYCYAIFPLLKAIYKDEDKLKAATLNHLQFFNTNPWIAPYIMGINAAMEERPDENTNDAVTAIKTGLMGPIAGLGDTLCVVIPWTIFGAIAANMALQNNPTGIFIWIAVSIAIKMLSIPLFKAGYNSGTKLIDSIQTSLKAVTEGMSILGVMVVGALIPSVIRAHVVLDFTQGDFVMEGQQILDSIMPGLIPALLVSLVYYLLKKGVKPIRVILICIALSIVLSMCGILG